MINRNSKGQFIKGHSLGVRFLDGHTLGFGKKRPDMDGNKFAVGNHPISEFKKGENVGERNTNWRGGITTENEKIRHNTNNKIWKKSVLTRDNFTCQRCGSCKKLNVHHINNFADFPEVRFAIDNGIIFCQKCHKEFHKRYGKRNNTSKQLLEYKTDTYDGYVVGQNL